MNRLLQRRAVFVTALAAVVAVISAFGLSACGSSGYSKDKAQMTAAIAGVTYMDNSGFHEIDDQLTQKGTLDPTAHSVAVHIQTVALTTDWPSELQAGAKGVAQAMGDFATAIDTDNPDLKKAAELSNKAHASWHAFSTQVWGHLEEQAGVKMSASEMAAHSH